MMPGRPVFTWMKMKAFGGFLDRSLGPFKEGLNVVEGKNEAGKSTASNFIYQMLYGWESARSSKPHYRPGGKGKRSGWLMFESDGDKWRLVRDEAKREERVITDEGTPWDTAFSDLTSGVDETTYMNVFSFNADQLRQLESTDTITSKLLTAGSATAVPPMDAYQNIQKRLEEYTNSRQGLEHSLPLQKSSISMLNDQKAELMAQLREEYEEYEDLLALEAKVDALKDERDTLRERRAALEEKQVKARQLMVKLEDAQERLDQGNQERQALVTEAESISIDNVLLDSGDTIVGLVAAIEGQQQTLGSIEQLTAQVQVAEDDLGSLPTPRVTIDENSEDILRKAQEDRAALVAAVKSSCTQAQDAEDAFQEASGRLEASRGSGSRNTGQKGLFGGGAILAVLGVVALLIPIFMQVPNVVQIAGAVAVIAGILCMAVAWISGGQGSGSETTLQDAAHLEEKVQEASGRLHKEKARNLRANEDLDRFDRDLAQRFGLKPEVEGGSGPPDDIRTAGDSPLYLQVKTVVEQGLAYNRKRQSRDELIRELDTEHKRFERWAKEAKGILEKAEGPYDQESLSRISGTELIAAMERLSQQSTKAREAGQRRHELQKRLETLEVEIAQNLQQVENLSRGLEEVLGKTDTGESVSAIERLEAEIISVKRSEQSVQDDIEASGALIAQKETLLEHTKKTEDLKELELKLAEAQARLDNDIEQFMVLRVAQQMLLDTIASWNEEKQPGIYQRASELFSQMTNGRWSEIRAGDKEGELLAVRHDLEILPCDHLSTSTTQLLYLALRLALLESTPEIGRSLPVVMDDAFVHLDEERSEQVAQIIGDFAQKRQVILFTFREDTVGLFERSAKLFNRVDLAGV